MQLQEYLKTNNLTNSQFVELIKITQPSLSRWLNGTRDPNIKMMKRIYRATNGQVTPNDFVLNSKKN